MRSGIEGMSNINDTTRKAWHIHGFDGSPAELLVDQTIIGAWERWVRSDPDHPVFSEFVGAWITASELHQRVTRVASTLVDEDSPSVIGC